MRQTKMGMLHALYVDNPACTNAEACELLGIDSQMLRTMKNRLKNQGYIHVEDNGEVTILKPYTRGVSTPNNFKADVYYEMVDAYMEDFRQQSTFNDRLAVGREIRLILEKL